MAMRSGLHIHPANGIGTSAREARQALAGLITEAGVLDGLRVTGTAGWQYSVAAGHVATSRDHQGDGVVLFANDASILVDCTPSPGSGARIDIIYAKHNDAADHGDPTNLPIVAVAEGIATGTPNAPDLPEGAVELARATVGSGATSTNHANVTIDHSQAPTAETYRNPAIAGGRTGTSTTTIPSGVITVVHPGGTADHYMGGVTGAPNGLSVPMSGWYDVDGGIQFASNSTGFRRIILQVNGSYRHMEQQRGDGQNTLTFGRKVWLDAGDVVTIAGWQDTGSDLSTTNNWGFPYLNVALLGKG